ncbi:MAG: hypothetical protein KY467_01295 [Gemmatimonadetes bacterium]|nr:hypothetical protein [Gemmatimonadota bacterium]
MEHTPDPDRLTRHEALFAALMQMEEGDLIQHVRSAPREDLPAEVLARAYRELWLKERFTPAEEVANRLFAGRVEELEAGEGAPEYMRWLYVAAVRFARKSPSREAPDLYQSALRQVIRALRGSQGAQAHKAWKSFCFDRLRDAWRERTRKDPPMVGLEVEDPERIPLTERFGLTRFQVYRLRKKAETALRRAAEEWTERDPRP